MLPLTPASPVSFLLVNGYSDGEEGETELLSGDEGDEARD